MLEYLIDDFVIWMYRNKWLKDFEKRDVYEYAIQIILYNAMLLIVTFLLSAFTHNIQSFVMFIVFFVILRRNIGGFHFKNKYICLTVSVSMYVLIMLLAGNIFAIYKIYMIIIWFFLSLICLFMPALKDKNYNKKIVNFIIVVDVILIFWGIYIKSESVAWAILYNICVLLMFTIQKIIELSVFCKKEER